MKDAPEADVSLPPQLVLLRKLVMGLLVVMILGFVVLIATLVTRIATKPALLPPEISLPADEKAAAVTFAEEWILVVSTSGKAFFFDRDSQKLLQEITLTPTP